MFVEIHAEITMKICAKTCMWGTFDLFLKNNNKKNSLVYTHKFSLDPGLCCLGPASDFVFVAGDGQASCAAVSDHRLWPWVEGSVTSGIAKTLIWPKTVTACVPRVFFHFSSVFLVCKIVNTFLFSVLTCAGNFAFSWGHDFFFFFFWLFFFFFKCWWNVAKTQLKGWWGHPFMWMGLKLKWRKEKNVVGSWLLWKCDVKSCPVAPSLTEAISVVYQWAKVRKTRSLPTWCLYVRSEQKF